MVYGVRYDQMFDSLVFDDWELISANSNWILLVRMLICNSELISFMWFFVRSCIHYHVLVRLENNLVIECWN